jgi:hypothetical protein
MPIRQRLVGALFGLLLSCGGSSPTPATSTFALTVSNFQSWCAVTVTQPSGTTLPNGATAASNKITLAAGTVVKLHGEPSSASFEWAPSAGSGGWSGAIDSGQNPLSKDITVTLNADKIVSVCCPFTNGSGCQ